ncbi:hypothetical protein [Ensifer aridi]|uniref:hypothetical protein n=1 Tax=Ensifer aridi TaxID=1708715 RepID=UPI00111C8E54|nr:hypothetical protein [Ensifer aridi]
MEVPAFEERHVTRPQRAGIKASLAFGHLAPVAHHHEGSSLQHKENFLVVAMTVKADTAVGSPDVEIHIIDCHELFRSGFRRLFFNASKLQDSITRPSSLLPSKRP